MKVIIKLVKKIIPVFLVFSIVALFFVGCNFDRQVAKASKNINSYEIVASFDDESKTITATQTVKYINKSETTLNSVWFHLYGTAFSETSSVKPYTEISSIKCFPNGMSYGDMTISSVQVGGSAADFSIVGDNNNILAVSLLEELFPSEKVTITIEFVLKLSNNTHRLGYFDSTVNLGNWYPTVCVYENGSFDADPYYSTGDPFFTEISNYKVSFTFPTNYTLASTGNLKKTTTNETMQTTEYEAKAVRDFAMVLGSAYTTTSEKVGDTTITVYAYSHDENINSYLETAKKALLTFNDLFGVYPYRTLKVVMTKFLHGGMEYPNLVFVSDSIGNELDIARVIVHEIAHQWWYGVVGNDQVENAWLDESMAEYSTLLFFEKNPEYGETRQQQILSATQSYLLYADVIESIQIKLNRRIDLATYKYTSEYEYVYMVYVKGMLMLDDLRNSIGDKDFFKGIKNYYQGSKFKVATKDSMIVAFETASKVDLVPFFDNWLSGNIVIEEIKS